MKLFIDLGSGREATVEISVTTGSSGRAEPTGAELLRTTRLLSSAFSADAPASLVRTTSIREEER